MELEWKWNGKDLTNKKNVIWNGKWNGMEWKYNGKKYDKSSGN